MADSLDAQIATARANGYTDAQIATYLRQRPDLAPKISQAARAGYSPSDVVSYLGGGAPADPGGVPPDAKVNLKALGARIIDTAGNSNVTPTNPYLGVPTSAPYTVNPRQESSWFDPGPGTAEVKDGAAQFANAKTGNDRAAGASRVIRGAMDATKPAVLLAAATNPVTTVAALGGGMAASKATDVALGAAGVSDGYRNLGSDVAGLVAGGAAGHGTDAALEPLRDFGLPFQVPSEPGPGLPARAVGSVIGANLDPSEAAAVQYGRDNGVKMRASVQSGSPVAAGAEKLLEHVPFGPSRIAEEAKAGERSSLADAGAREVAGLNPSAEVPARPLDAGEALQQAALELEQKHTATANDAYDMFRSIEAQPQFKAEVQTGTKLAPTGETNPDGSPVVGRVPVMEEMQAPVDRRAAKLALKPVLDRMLRLTPLAQEQSSVGIKALRNIVEGPDYESASVTDEDLGAVKGILRDSSSDRSRGLAKFAVDQLSKAVDNTVAKMGPDAVDALQRGRQSTLDKYAAQDYQKALGFKNVGMGTPADVGSAVDLVGKLSADRDRNISLLRQVAANAPEHIPAIGQAVAQGLLDHVTADAGMDKAQTALRSYTNLGPETRKILFGSQDANLKNFFTLAKRLADNPNKSGTGPMMAIMKAGGLALTSPVTGAGALLGSRVLARMLFNPETSPLITRALQTSADAKGAGLLGKQLSAAAERMGGAEAAAAPAAAAPAPKASPDTFVTVPGEPGNVYRAQYKLKELADLQASHSGKTFQPNPNYPLDNDRNYMTATNQGPVIGWSSRGEFDPKQLINDNPDAVNGPMVTDSQGNVLGGNGRAMILERVHTNPDHPGIEAYKNLLKQKAAQFGLDAKDVDAMRQPVLVREIADSEFAGRTKQQAISDFNKTGTKALTPSERAVSDAKRVSPETLEHVAAQLEAEGPDATVADVLQGKGGLEVLNRLIKDGVITDQQRGALEDKNGLTEEGRDRISALMAGRFFKDSKTLDAIAPSTRNKVTRLAAPLAQVEGRGAWNLTPDMQEAVELLHSAQAVGAKNIDDYIKQDGLFGAQKWPENAQQLARAISKLNPNELVAAARQYAGESNYEASGGSLFGDNPTPENSFSEAFGDTAIERAIAARKEKKNALAGDTAAAKSKNSLAK